MRKFPEISEETSAIDAFDPSVDSFTQALINRKVSQLIKRFGFEQYESDDLKQEILIRVIKSLESYDASVGHLNPFITAVVDRHVSTLLRDRSTIKRTSGSMGSLNVNVDADNGGSSELIQIIGDREVDRRLGRERTLSEEQLNDLRSDMGSVIARLPKQLQEFLELRKTLSLNEISAQLNTPRSTLGDWTEEIRSHFAAAGLERYFHK